MSRRNADFFLFSLSCVLYLNMRATESRPERTARGKGGAQPLPIETGNRPTHPNPVCRFQWGRGRREEGDTRGLTRHKGGARNRQYFHLAFRSTALIYPLVGLSKVARKKGGKKPLTLNLDKLFFSPFLSAPTL